MRTFRLCDVDGRSIGVEMLKVGVWAGVCCPLTRGVDQASRKCDWGNDSDLGVFSVESGATDFGVEVGLGRCQSEDLTKQQAVSFETFGVH